MTTIDELAEGMKQAVFDAGVKEAWTTFDTVTDLVAAVEGVGQQQLCFLCALKIIKLLAECPDEGVFEYFLEQIKNVIDEGSRDMRKQA
jgi:hypothetical protein